MWLFFSSPYLTRQRPTLWVCVRPGPPNLMLQYLLVGNELFKLDLRVTTLQPERSFKESNQLENKRTLNVLSVELLKQTSRSDLQRHTYAAREWDNIQSLCTHTRARAHTHTPIWHMSTCSTCTLPHMDRAQVAQHIYLLPPHTLPWDNIHISPHLGGAAGGDRCENERIPALENVVGPKSVPFVSQRGMESWIWFEFLRSAGISEEVLTVKSIDDMKVLKV